MGIRRQAGFTIIEVMLFLAVTGALTVAILVGSGVSINQQRYRDSVNTLKSVIQDQYSEASNVTNSRSGNSACTNAVVVQPPASVPTPQPRGTSDCVLMGRLFTIGNNGIDLTASNIVGYRTSSTAPTEATDFLELTKNYKMAVSPIDADQSQVEWGAKIVKPKTTTVEPLSIMIIHSPLSGSILTFVGDGVATGPTALNALAAAGINNKARDICVDAEPGSFVGKRQAIRINAFASTASAIEIPSESEGVCD
jgi:type II secretory pathway pseudopilin PulG